MSFLHTFLPAGILIFKLFSEMKCVWIFVLLIIYLIPGVEKFDKKNFIYRKFCKEKSYKSWLV